MYREALEIIRYARTTISKYSPAQIEYARKAYYDCLDCWNIDATDDEEFAKAARRDAETKFDWMVGGIEDELFDDETDFNRLYNAITKLGPDANAVA